ncbi:MBL fold metallo-hydrolase [Halobellus ruber]|uniref:MBL fold metallo-hydrolase n=1 Tax=Halobellus ruber TaxID=2761102 RepID=A0A7J9SLG7_9EURY|nr:MBL fold metallo-hydrolase [Halobellus ruber]
MSGRSAVANGLDRVSVPVEGRAPTGATNAYLVGEELLVDPAGRTDDLDAAVDATGIEHIAVTHAHPDHVGAVAEYAAETGATVWCRRGFEARFAQATGIQPDRTVVEGTRIPAGDGVDVIDVQGHAPDHVAFEAAAGTVCGDVAIAESSVAVAAPEGDLRGYLVGLRRLHARNPPRLCPGHGPVIDDPRATCRRLLDHRRDRERRVLAAVRDGASDVDAVVDAAYDKDLSGFEDLARATVVAHLEKLDVEGRVAFDPETGTVAPA